MPTADPSLVNPLHLRSYRYFSLTPDDVSANSRLIKVVWHGQCSRFTFAMRICNLRLPESLQLEYLEEIMLVLKSSLRPANHPIVLVMKNMFQNWIQEGTTPWQPRGVINPCILYRHSLQICLDLHEKTGIALISLPTQEKSCVFFSNM